MKYLLACLLVAGVFCMSDHQAYADASLQLQPLQYEEVLSKGERKKGFVDVTNPLSEALKVKFTIEGFRQIDTAGNLAFYQDEQLASGITLDYDEFDIPAKKTLRLFFVVDSTKLPSGDVFAALFARTASEANGSVAPAVRIGTLLILTNGTPSARRAEVTDLQLPLLQMGKVLTGRAVIKNTAPVATANGFFPTISISSWPFGSTARIKGPLVFAGNSREVPFSLNSNQFGVYKISASYGASHQERWVLLVTGMWRWLVPSVLVVGLLVYGYFSIWRRRMNNR